MIDIGDSILKIIGGCIFILLFLTIISLISGNDFVSVSIAESYNLSQVLNGTTSDLDFNLSGDLALDPLTFAIIWITVIGGIAVASGVTVLSSGLSPNGQHWLIYMIFFVAIWLMFSTFPFPMIIAIETVGATIYTILTMVYAIACIIWIGGAR